MAKVVTRFPRQVKVVENIFIPMSDGVKLAAKLWLPEDAEQNPVPARFFGKAMKTGLIFAFRWSLSAK